MRPVLILRPQPGADATAARVCAQGLEAIVRPLFRIVPLEWTPPTRPADAILMTSANAARSLSGEMDLKTPLYAVGAATADAARAAGFHNVVVGRGDVVQVVRRAAADGIKSLLHLTGTDRTGFDPEGVRIEVRAVYAAEPIEPPPALADTLSNNAVALLHSARAARKFRELAGSGHRIAAISPAVLAAAGDGWADTAVASVPTDDALLAAAAPLCH